MSNLNEFPGGQDMAEEAARLSERARSQARETRARAADAVERASDGQRGAAVDERFNQGLRAAGQQIGKLARQVRERAPAGQAGETAHAAAGVLEQGAGYLQGADAERLRGDIEALIRRHPVQAIALGVGLGFILGRAVQR